MKILVANLGSTSFKYRLFDMNEVRQLARGGVERIGSNEAQSFAESERGRTEQTLPIADHATAVESCIQILADPEFGALNDAGELAAIGFKAVHAQGYTGVQRINENVLTAMEAFNDVAPAHNPPYVRAMRLLAEKLPHIPLVAAFETGFHETIPPAHRLYAIPYQWTEEFGIKRWGFHGASHRYISERTSELLGRPGGRIISCHLGGSSSICSINEGKSLANSLGMSPQSGLPHNNRVGDFDVFALPAVMKATGMALKDVLNVLASESGLKGLSGAGNDLRDIEAAAAKGNTRARTAIDVYIASIRHYIGAYLVQMNGADAICFTGGIGENSHTIRAAVCENLDWFGISLDSVRNEAAQGESAIHGSNSRVKIWTVPTNEELIVARQVQESLRP